MFVFILRVKEYSETWLFVYPSLHYPAPPPTLTITTYYMQTPVNK